MRILFADPDRELVAAYEKLLRQEGHEVVPAYDGVQALELLNSDPPELMVLRRELPLLPSETVLEAARRKEVPEILLSKEDAAEERNVLAFPFLPEELIRRLKEVTEHE